MSEKISIVIPTHKRAAQVAQLLRSIDTQSHVLDIEVLVVTNFPDTTLANIIKKSSRPVQLLVANKRGVNASRNLGLERSSGDVVLLLDDDCVLHKRDFLRRVLNAHRVLSDVQIIGGGYESNPSARFEQQAYNFISTAWCEAYQYNLSHSWALLGGNVSYKASVRDDIYRFDESISYGGSETEFHVRLHAQGFQMKYLSDLSVEHAPNVKSPHIFDKAIKQAKTAKNFQFPQNSRANDLSKYLYTRRAARAAQSESQFQQYLELYRLHEDAFLRMEQFNGRLPKYKRLLNFHWKSFLC